MSHSTELRQRLQAAIGELEDDLARLRAAVAALDRNGVSASSESAVRRPHRSPADGAPAHEVVPAGKLASLLSSSENGLSTAELARETNGDRDQILALLKELEQSGRARRTGIRRATRWHAAAQAAGRSETVEPSAAAAEPPEPTEAEEQIATALEPVVAS